MHLLAALCCSMRHNSGFSILLKDTSACRFFGKTGDRTADLQVGGRPLYPLRHSRPLVSLCHCSLTCLLLADRSGTLCFSVEPSNSRLVVLFILRWGWSEIRWYWKQINFPWAAVHLTYLKHSDVWFYSGSRDPLYQRLGNSSCTNFLMHRGALQRR